MILRKFTIQVLAILFFGGISSVEAQITLTYKSHAPTEFTSVTKQRGQFMGFGEKGENITWDFSELNCSKAYTGDIVASGLTEKAALFPTANVSVLEGSKVFYHELTNEQFSYNGLVGSQSVIYFDEPIIKMKYPFAYGDSFESKFSGHGIYNSSINSNFKGEYSFEADAFGTLILPGNLIITNVLRVKQTRHTVEVTACSHTETTNEKYLWYSQHDRSPILAVTQTTVNSTGKKPKSTRATYYNDNPKSVTAIANIKKTITKLSTYPNPFTQNITLEFTLAEMANKISIAVYDIRGQEITRINHKPTVGLNHVIINSRENGIVSGIYYVQIATPNDAILTKIIKAD